MKTRTRILVAKWDEETKVYKLDGWVSRDGEWWVQPVGHDEWPDALIQLKGGPRDGEYAGY